MSIQPFYCLHLDINGVTTIEEALHRFASVESLEGVTDTKTSFGVAASKHMTLERLPRVLILHLKRFSFDEKSQKISDHVIFGVNLVLDPSLVSPNLLKTSQRKYKLSSGKIIKSIDSLSDHTSWREDYEWTLHV